MEGLFEANRLVEVSMSKLNCLHKGGELPLRKTLMISKVLNKAQNIATSAHYSLLHTSSQTPTRSSSSKLLASITKKVETSSSSCFEDDPLPQKAVSTTVRTTTAKGSSRELSPIVSCSNVSRTEGAEEEEEAAMDFESVNSVLSNILSDCDTPPSRTESSSSPLLVRASSTTAGGGENLNETRSGAPGSSTRPCDRFLSDLSNTAESVSVSSWNQAWRFDVNTEVDNTWRWSSSSLVSQDQPPAPSSEPNDDNTTLLSPGKRHRQEAFPYDDKENLLLTTDGLLYEDTKRFKSSPPEGCPLESLPGFCGYLSPRNLQSAPLITYMFGRGFAEPSNPSTTDWPASFSPSRSATAEHRRREADAKSEEAPVYPNDHFAAHFEAPAVKFSPILAF